MKGLTLAVFLRDRLLYIVVCMLIIFLSVLMLLLERERYPKLIELNTVFYFVVLALFFVALWLVLDYLRLRPYYKQLLIAIERSDGLFTSAILHEAVTREQKLAARLLEEQHRAYLDELGKYRRQQELHNHFALQWVHHMKTPVSVIDLLSQEALRQTAHTEEEQRHFAASVQEEAERITNGLEMMLYSARIDKFEFDLRIERTALHELARGVLNAHKRLCIRHSIFPRLEGEAWVETDPKWMTFVLNQFVSNAIKYSKNKPGSKSLLLRIMPQANNGTLLSVQDEGIGIPSHDIPRIYDPFFTGENGRTTGESTGMGLYLTKQVCGRLGHALSVLSEAGKGTTFTVSFSPQGIHRLAQKHE
ncbi:sensor histidine kinase [Paenibacillus harenae]|uniref:histidine kinase n=1 Tax=Paenibacillus harenae TaxID=306543 RepID=A0ABT9U6S8_PAEHA|nr:sensor histidine kinase [Paenibacillus harenae]MDQ0115341.1 signal transduction histidine kinase [Paenibacillus harenae]